MEKRIRVEIGKLQYNVNYTGNIVSYFNDKINALVEINVFKYPFICPSITINNYSYYSFLHCKFVKEMKYLSKNNDCFCCRSLTCDKNWNLMVSLENINNEIEKVINLNRRAFDLFLCSKIVHVFPVEMQVEIMKYI